MTSRLIVHYGIIVVTLVCITGNCDSYELHTHARLTYKAYERSILANNVVLHSLLGIDKYSEQSLGEYYFDLSDTTVYKRNATSYPLQFMKPTDLPSPTIPFGTSYKSMVGWLMRGAVREDDLGYITNPFGVRHPFGKDPYDDPHGAIFRVLEHFFDPTETEPGQQGLHGLALDAFLASPLCDNCAGTYIHAAPNWALGTDNAFSVSAIEESGRRNHFTVLDAREAMYRALTGHRSTGESAIVPTDDGSLRDPTDATELREVRRTYWATAFRALGDVLHLVEDMAQPQHTRNDLHNIDFGHGETVYEAYIERRAQGGSWKCLNGQPLKFSAANGNGLVYTGYPIPRFDKYSAYFSTQQGGAALQGLGLADYSNRGFFTAGTNIEDTSYALPSTDPGDYIRQSADTMDLCLKKTVRLEYLLGTVKDALTKVDATDVALTSRGLWTIGAGFSRYALTRKNYDDMADLLTPRAVAYGAGLLDYFFRGRLRVNSVKASLGVLTVSVTNQSYYDRTKQQAGDTVGDGSFVLVARYRLNGEDGFSASAQRWFSGTIAPGETREILVDVGDAFVPNGATDVSYQVVFYGHLGREANAIAVGSWAPTALLAAWVDPAGTKDFEIRRSEDGGKTWVTAYKVHEPNATFHPNFWPTFISGVGKGRALFCAGGYAYRSQDNGVGWDPWPAEACGGNNAAAPDGKGNIVAIWQDDAGGLKVVSSSDMGLTWAARGELTVPVYRVFRLYHLNGDSWLLDAWPATAECKAASSICSVLTYLSVDGMSTWNEVTGGSIGTPEPEWSLALGDVGWLMRSGDPSVYLEDIQMSKDFSASWNTILTGSFWSGWGLTYMGDGQIVSHIYDVDYQPDTVMITEKLAMSEDWGKSWRTKILGTHDDSQLTLEALGTVSMDPHRVAQIQ